MNMQLENGGEINCMTAGRECEEVKDIWISQGYVNKSKEYEEVSSLTLVTYTNHELLHK